MTKVIDRTSSMLDTPPQDKLYTHLQVFNACEHSWIMMIMGGSKMSKTEYHLKAIYILPMTYPQKLCNMRGITISRNPDYHPILQADPCISSNDTAYGICISTSLSFPFMVPIFPCFPYMVSVFPCFLYMVMLPKHLNRKAIVLDRALLWMLHCPVVHYWRHNDRTYFFMAYGGMSGSPVKAITGCQSMNNLLDFKAIFCVIPRKKLHMYNWMQLLVG